MNSKVIGVSDRNAYDIRPGETEVRFRSQDTQRNAYTPIGRPHPLAAPSFQLRYAAKRSGLTDEQLEVLRWCAFHDEVASRAIGLLEDDETLTRMWVIQVRNIIALARKKWG